MGRLQAIHDEDFDALLFWAGSQKSYDDGVSAMERNSELPTEAFVGQLQLSSRRTFPRQSRLCRDSRHAHRRRGRDCGRSGRNLLHHHRHLVARRRRTLPTRRHLARRHPTGAMDRRVRPGTTRDHAVKRILLAIALTLAGCSDAARPDPTAAPTTTAPATTTTNVTTTSTTATATTAEPTTTATQSPVERRAEIEECDLARRGVPPWLPA